MYLTEPSGINKRCSKIKIALGLDARSYSLLRDISVVRMNSQGNSDLGLTLDHTQRFVGFLRPEDFSLERSMPKLPGGLNFCASTSKLHSSAAFLLPPPLVNVCKQVITNDDATFSVTQRQAIVSETNGTHRQHGADGGHGIGIPGFDRVLQAATARGRSSWMDGFAVLQPFNSSRVCRSIPDLLLTNSTSPSRVIWLPGQAMPSTMSERSFSARAHGILRALALGDVRNRSTISNRRIRPCATAHDP